MDLSEKKISNGNRHPWELSRTHCIIKNIKKYSACTVVDIGAGDLFFISNLSSFVSGALYAIDTGYDEKNNLINGIHCFKDISDLLELCTETMIILMDILEHIENDNAFLNDIIEKMPEDGLIFITVPSFQFLFSIHDIFLKHYRRYNRKQLLDLLISNKLCVEKCHYFYASLFFARLVGFLFRKKNKKQQFGIGKWRFREKHIITQAIYAILNIDFCICVFLAKFHIYLPGLSLFAICKKRGDRYIV